MKLMVLGLAMVAALASMAAGAGGLDVASAQGWFIGEDSDGNLVIGGPSTDHNAVCGGFAGIPNGIDFCTTGTHVRAGSIIHGSMEFGTCGRDFGVPEVAVVGSCYIGAVTSQLVHATGARTFTCQIVYSPVKPLQGPLNLLGFGIACAGVGTFPPLGATFDHKCYSDDLNTPGAGDSGTGYGGFNCDITHA